MASQPCNMCQNYDPIIRGKTEGRHGRCAAKSTYPAVEQKGQTFPPNAKRAPAGEPCKPVIVVGEDIIPACNLFRAKPPKAPGKRAS